MMKKTLLATGISLIWFVNAQANMPVFDSFAWIESVQQTKAQLDQYQLQLENAKSLGSYNWDDTNTTITQLLNTIDTLKYYKEQAGGMDAYLNNYQTSDYYKNQPCFNGSYCNEEALKAIYAKESLAFNAQKKANDAMLKGIDKQQQTLESDAKKVKKLQTQAQNAQGQMSAIQAANQLASAEVNQLLQIRGLMVASHNAQAARSAALANKEAIQEAGDARFRAGKFRKSPERRW